MTTTGSGCACGEASEVGEPLNNLAGQTSLHYRIGVHGSFRDSMLAKLGAGLPLATRRPDDASVALVDAWAVVGDILTFYQERIANEGFLGTATQERSVVELAAMVGYQRLPGAAATAWLAFTVESAVSAVPITTVPAGTRVRSIPGPGETPQTFETSEEVEARIEWNELKPKLTRPQSLAVDITSGEPTLVAFGLSGGQSDDVPGTVYPLVSDKLDHDASTGPVDVQKIYLAGTDSGIERGDRLLFVGKKDDKVETFVAVAQTVVLDTKNARTQVHLTHAPDPISQGTSTYDYAKLVKEPKKMTSAVFTSNTTSYTSAASSGVTQSFVSTLMEAASTVYIGDVSAHAVGNVAVSAGGDDSTADTAPPEDDDLLSIDDMDPGVFLFKERVGCFGHNAPAHASVDHDKFPNDWDLNDNIQSTGLPSGTSRIYLERAIPEVIDGTWALLQKSEDDPPVACVVQEAVERSLAAYAMSGRVTALKLADSDGSIEVTDLSLRGSSIDCRSLALTLAVLPIEAPLEELDDEGNTVPAQQIVLHTLVEGLTSGKVALLTGEVVDDDEDQTVAGTTVTEVLVIDETADLPATTEDTGCTILFLVDRLAHRYVRSTVKINANVAEATTGETVSEVLGSGDATVASQRFVLKRPPLTFVPDTTPSGVSSTLVVRVAGVEWTEVSAFHDQSADARVYTVQISDDSSVTVTFGDGERGARLPTGTQNVTATYRTGIGSTGNVSASSLSVLQSRPTGIREVTNPLAASGGTDPEAQDQARLHAPLRVRTLDRIVSARDYEDFALSVVGIAKAQAVPLWQGEHRIVGLTVAAADAVTLSTEQLEQLSDAIRESKDPAQRFLVGNATTVPFVLGVEVLPHADYDSTVVLESVEEALVAAFSFDQRALAATVTTAEVLQVVHAVPGVRAGRVTTLYESGEESGAVPAWLPAPTAGLDPDGTALTTAGVLVVDEDTLSVTEMVA
jgi:uncharacterized phage protein gp47/JayE